MDGWNNRLIASKIEQWWLNGWNDRQTDVVENATKDLINSPQSRSFDRISSSKVTQHLQTWENLSPLIGKWLKCLKIQIFAIFCVNVSLNLTHNPPGSNTPRWFSAGIEKALHKENDPVPLHPPLLQINKRIEKHLCHSSCDLDSQIWVVFI